MGKQIGTKIRRYGDRHRDMKRWRYEDMEILKCPSSGIGWRASSVGSVRRSVGSVRFGLIL